MDIENLSHTPIKRIRPLLDFLVKKTGFSYMACLFLFDATKPQVGGHAYKANPEACKFKTALPSIVKLWVPSEEHDMSYPRTIEHVEEVGPIRVTSWLEEVLLVLAHELRHMDQFWTNKYTQAQAHEAEVDAEQFAKKMLDMWRISYPVPTKAIVHADEIQNWAD